MEIKLKNKELNPLFGAINKIKLETIRLNRFKTRFIKRLIEKEVEFEGDLKNIRLEYAQTDDLGELKTDEKGFIILKNKELEEDFIKEIDTLDEEEIFINFGEQSDNFKELFLAFAESNPEEELTFLELSVLDDVLEQIESEEAK